MRGRAIDVSFRGKSYHAVLPHVETRISFGFNDWLLAAMFDRRAMRRFESRQGVFRSEKKAKECCV
jgi:hypothetical protein